MTTGHQPQPEEVMHQVQAELANAYAQEFFSTVREKCFKMCVSKPSSALSGYERKCLEQCTERYVDATRMISQVVLKQYSQGGGGGGGARAHGADGADAGVFCRAGTWAGVSGGSWDEAGRA